MQNNRTVLTDILLGTITGAGIFCLMIFLSPPFPFVFRPSDSTTWNNFAYLLLGGAALLVRHVTGKALQAGDRPLADEAPPVVRKRTSPLRTQR